MKRLTKKESEVLRGSLIAAQDNTCVLCLDTLEGKTACLDHDHKSGRIRSVLCLNCNGIEGKIFNLCRRAKRDRTETDFLVSLFYYWMAHDASNPIPEGKEVFIHYLHKTEAEKRSLRNKKARLRRSKK